MYWDNEKNRIAGEALEKKANRPGEREKKYMMTHMKNTQQRATGKKKVEYCELIQTGALDGSHQAFDNLKASWRWKHQEFYL